MQTPKFALTPHPFGSSLKMLETPFEWPSKGPGAESNPLEVVNLRISVSNFPIPTPRGTETKNLGRVGRGMASLRPLSPVSPVQAGFTFLGSSAVECHIIICKITCIPVAQKKNQNGAKITLCSCDSKKMRRNGASVNGTNNFNLRNPPS